MSSSMDWHSIPAVDSSLFERPTARLRCKVPMCNQVITVDMELYEYFIEPSGFMRWRYLGSVAF